jgi:hypothetical protein
MFSNFKRVFIRLFMNSVVFDSLFDDDVVDVVEKSNILFRILCDKEKCTTNYSSVSTGMK